MTKKLSKLGLAAFLVAAIFATLWFTSAYFRAWIKYPAHMYRCDVEMGWPAEACVGMAAFRSMVKGGQL